MGPALTANNSAVRIVPNVKVRMEAQHSVPTLGLHDLPLGKSLPLQIVNKTVFIRRQL